MALTTREEAAYQLGKTGVDEADLEQAITAAVRLAEAQGRTYDAFGAPISCPE